MPPLQEHISPTLPELLRQMFSLLNGYPAWLTRIPEGDLGFIRQAKYNDYGRMMSYTIWSKVINDGDDLLQFAVLLEESLHPDHTITPIT